MRGDRVVVVGETPSLGAAVNELLLSDRYDSRLVSSLESAERLLRGHRPSDPTVIVTAANGAFCATFLLWPKSSLRDLELVVVGDRYRTVVPSPHVHVLRLPIDPEELLGLVRRLLESRRSVRRSGGTRRLPVVREPMLGIDRLEPEIALHPGGLSARGVPSGE